LRERLLEREVRVDEILAERRSCVDAVIRERERPRCVASELPDRERDLGFDPERERERERERCVSTTINFLLPLASFSIGVDMSSKIFPCQRSLGDLNTKCLSLKNFSSSSYKSFTVPSSGTTTNFEDQSAVSEKCMCLKILSLIMCGNFKKTNSRIRTSYPHIKYPTL
jgi:hypothetical protein